MNNSPNVSATWLSDHLDDPQLVIVDCRFSLMDAALGRKQYQNSHIVGAYHLDLNLDLSRPAQKHGGRHPLPDIEQLATKLSQMGIVSGKTMVAIYDDSRFGFAARLWWLLRYMGHERVVLLDGGFANWQAQNYPVSDQIPPSKIGNFVLNLQTEWIVDIQDIKARKDLPAVVLVDSREGDRYRGEREPIDPIAGHIAGAVNYPWMEVTNEQGFVINQGDRWQDIRNAEEIIVYCGSGVTACVNLLSLKLAGIEGAKLYAGSWSDWCSYLIDKPQIESKSESQISFRLAQFIDIDPLIELVQEFYQFEKIDFSQEVLKAFTSLLSDETFGLIWLICDRDRPIGYFALTFFFSMEYHGRCGLLDELYIREEYRGKGIAKKVFPIIEEYLQSQNMRSLSLVVDHWNEPAEALYTKLGFRREMRYLMVKNLPKK